PHTFLQPVTRLPLVARGLGESRSGILHTPNFHRDHREAGRAGRCVNLTHIQQGDRLPALAKIANPRRAGSTARKSASRLLARAVCWSDKPVTLPPITPKPVPTGSPPAKTIGITGVACFAARTLTVRLETITSIFCWTNSATISVARSLRPSGHRTLIATK